MVPFGSKSVTLSMQIDVVENVREFDRINWPLTSEMLTFLYACNGCAWKQFQCLCLCLIGGLRGSTATSALVIAWWSEEPYYFSSFLVELPLHFLSTLRSRSLSLSLFFEKTFLTCHLYLRCTRHMHHWQRHNLRSAECVWRDHEVTQPPPPPPAAVTWVRSWDKKCTHKNTPMEMWQGYVDMWICLLADSVLVFSIFLCRMGPKPRYEASQGPLRPRRVTSQRPLQPPCETSQSWVEWLFG